MAKLPKLPAHQTGRAAAAERWRRRITATVTLLTPLLVLIIGLLLSNQLSRAESLRVAETASHDRRTLVIEVLAAHSDLETGQRGYLLTGNEGFLEPYRSGSQQIAELSAQLRRAYAYDETGAALLRPVETASARKREFVDRTIAVYRDEGQAAALRLVATGTGKALMDDLRLKIAQLQNYEVTRLQRSRDEAAAGASKMRWVILLLVWLLLVLLVAAIVAAFRLLRARSATLHEIEEISRRQGAILDSAMDAILTLNPSGSIETVNATALKMFGFDEAELLRRDVGMLFATPPPIGAVAEMLRGMQLKPGTPGTLQEIIGRRKDRTTFPTDVAITAMPLVEGQHYVAVVRDVTERQRVEQLKSEFVSTVSHELRTPLTSISGSLGLLAGGAAGELGDKARRLIEIAKNNADRLVRLINDILDIEKIESGKMRFENVPLDLGEAIEAAITANRGFADQFRVALRFDRGAPAMVLADPDRLAQVLTNLLSNAIKFSPAQAEVRVELHAGEPRHRISVCDSGPGIPDAFRARMFEKFAQADSSDARQLGGTGLGLSIVREIVDRLGGSISFDCPPEGGTRFHVDLPALAGPAAVPSHTAQPVLLCGAAIGEMLRQRLVENGQTAEVVSTVEEVRSALANRSFAAVVVDLAMDRGAGVAVIRAARASALNAQAPVLALGGKPAGDELAGDAALVADWMEKPVSPDDLARAVAQAIAGAEDAQPHVLHVDDDPDVLQIVAGALERRARLTSVATLAAAREALQQSRFDLVVLDLTLKDGNGADLLIELNRNSAAAPPVIIFSAEDAHSAAADLVGAFLTKSRTPLSELVAWVERLASSRGRDPA